MQRGSQQRQRKQAKAMLRKNTFPILQLEEKSVEWRSIACIYLKANRANIYFSSHRPLKIVLALLYAEISTSFPKKDVFNKKRRSRWERKYKYENFQIK